MHTPATSSLLSRLATRSPDPQPESYDRLTLATLIITSTLIIILNSYRIYHHYLRDAKFTKLHYWFAASIIFISLRLGFICVSTISLTATFDRKKFPEEWMSQEEKDRRELGAQMVLPGRATYAMFVWSMKICVLYWIENVIQREKYWGMVFDTTFWVFITTLVAVVGITFLECQPMKLYWQIYPDPGKCTHAQIQLVSMASLNIFTDIILILIPLPVLLRIHLPVFRKLQLAALFSVSLFVITVTIIRMPLIVQSGSLQKLRSFWASVECFAAAIVANAPLFNSIFQDWLAKRRINSPNLKMRTGDGDAAGGGAGLGDVRETITNGKKRKARAPVTGVDSNGSLTRHEIEPGGGIEIGGEKNWKLSPSLNRPSIYSTNGIGGQGRKGSVGWGVGMGNTSPRSPGPDWAELQNRPVLGSTWNSYTSASETKPATTGAGDEEGDSTDNVRGFGLGYAESPPDRPPSSITKPPTTVEESWFRHDA
ncbi:hypothetical protein EX30DRAFT_345391 [Ascodesmis nigricans]|uniref:Rhodopsin domain-containing protein n=1 Tax=Ascodesmis nigricans TaxID=341454 RepID=A0A4S2N626_9PEZI|nr:hypothetical protein EX30DRAFT_345391 [Ascodesmis nigricans]